MYKQEPFLTNAHTGLTDEEALRQLKKYGENQLKEEKVKTPFQMFMEQLNEPLIFVLFVAAAVSMLLRELSDTLIIIAVILMNAVVGMIQEGKAQKALEALKKLASPTALVKRSGNFKEISARDLVPGDVVGLEAGRQVPADLRLVSAVNLKIDEAALTGESVPVNKDHTFIARGEIPLGDQKNMAFMSTTVSYGRGEGIVVATGMNTQIGKIAGLISETKKEITPLQKRLSDLGKLLSLVAVVLCVILFIIALIQKRNILEMLITAISLAVAAVPEGLPAVVTIVLALSVSRMVKVNTIIRKLPSVETLGSVSVVCSDKTGTLTQNKMKVTKAFTNNKLLDIQKLDYQKNPGFFEGFILCNDAFISGGNRIGDPTELALLDMGMDKGISKEALQADYPRYKELPFDSVRKMMTTLHVREGGEIAYTKGSGDAILKRCSSIFINGQAIPITGNHKRQIRHVMEVMATDALRVLALAVSTEVNTRSRNEALKEQHLIFIGLVGMIDPPREEAARAIEIFKQANVKTIMITGDHIDTAFAIARQLKIASGKTQCITGEALDRFSENEFKEKIMDLTVFARVSPEHKVRIVKTFKSLGHIVAMTGDGVNDAPSLKAADIGIAMGKNGTDVAKNASELILTDDNFATIEKAIEEGRGIYENIKKSVLFLLSSNFGEIITMFAAILLGLATPLKASHILWVNLITDSLPALALGVDQNDGKALMEKPPRAAGESLFAGGGLMLTLFYGCLIAGLSLTAFLTIPYGYLTREGLPIILTNIQEVLKDAELLARARTYAFTVLGVSQLFHAIGMRNMNQSIFKMKLFSNKMMIAAFFAGIGLQMLVTGVPYLIEMFGTVKLTLHEWFHLIFLSSVPLIAHELLLIRPAHTLQAFVKKIFRRQYSQTYQK